MSLELECCWSCSIVAVGGLFLKSCAGYENCERGVVTEKL